MAAHCGAQLAAQPPRQGFKLLAEFGLLQADLSIGVGIPEKLHGLQVRVAEPLVVIRKIAFLCGAQQESVRPYFCKRHGSSG